MARVTEAQVRQIIDTDADFSLTPFIDTANALTDYVSSKDTNSELTAALLVQIEKWLAAHFYAIRDPQPQEERTEEASAVHQGKTELGLDLTHWGQQAKRLDVTGTLAQLDRTKHRVSVQWLGLAPSEQTAYIDRD